MKYVSCVLLFSALMFNCSTDPISEEEDSIVGEEPVDTNLIRWDFDDLTGWLDGSQNMNGLINYNINENGELYMYSRANTYDRPKVKTEDKIYVDGSYTWRVYVPEMGAGDQASIGAFLYHDDTHELDFEIGYGTTAVREELGAGEDYLIVYLTSQSNPFQSIKKVIKREAWYDLTITLSLVDGTYYAKWFVNGYQYAVLDLEYGPEVPFYIFCSIENLTFLGDHIAAQDNYALFDYVEYLPY